MLLFASLLRAQMSAGEAPPPPGQLIDVGGWKLHLNCVGTHKEGTPTVIFESGAGGSSLDWALVQPGVAAFTQACAYDRAGTAWSELGPRPRTIRQTEYELHTLMAKAGIPGSYVLVGHSMGGIMVRNFAAQFPGEVAAMVLVDSTSDDSRLVHFGKLMRIRDDTTSKPIPPVRSTILPAEKQMSVDEKKMADDMLQHGPPPPSLDPASKWPLDVQRMRIWISKQPERTTEGSPFTGQEFAELYIARHAQQNTLDNIPLIVLIAGKRQEMPNLPPEWRVTNQEVNQQEEELASLSSRGKFIYVENSTHNVPYDEPQAVVDAVRKVVKAASKP